MSSKAETPAASASSAAAAASSSTSSTSAKVTLKWRKKVKMEYARLRQQKKFRHQDDMRLAWRNNRATLDREAAVAAAAGEVVVKREPGLEAAAANAAASAAEEAARTMVRRHKTPVWSVSACLRFFK